MSTWVGIGRSEIGLIRTSNQDAFGTIDRLGLWVVADGMGGHVGGEVAAHTAIATITSQAELSADDLHQGRKAPADFLTDLVAQAHEAIHERVVLEPWLKGMGTTIVLFMIVPLETPMAHVAHLGDSRAYRFRLGTLTPLTRDHTLMQTYIARGILTEETARTHPERHVLTRALGMASPARPTVTSHPVQQGDLFLLCTDGLTKMLEDDDIQNIFVKSEGNPIRICDQLTTASLDRGGLDNVTTVVITET